MKRFTAFITFLLFSMAATSYAQFEAKTYSFSPTIGLYTFDHHQELKSSALAGLRISRHLTPRWALEAVLQYVPTDSKLKAGRDNEVSGLLYHLDGLYHFPLGEKWVPFLAAGAGAMTLDGNVTGADTNLIVNYGGGLKYLYSDQMAVRADIRQVLTDDNGTEHNMVYTLGLEFSWGRGEGRSNAKSQTAAPVSAGAPAVGDSDKDGVPDTHDLCANTPLGVAVDQEGCPLDGDGDGTPDHLDKCPDTPKGLITDKNGCTLDTDKDGVPDSRDYCADTPPGITVDEKGCPPPQGAGSEADSDGDGVPDSKDLCPNTPVGTTVDEMGCALQKDSDHDGILDEMDKCPGTPAGTRVNEDGCPNEIKTKTTTQSHIRFETGKSEIRPAFMGEVQRIAEYLKKFPNASIEIEGHTDNTGPEKLNKRLSLERAESLKEVLVNRFAVEASRLTTQGYSWDRPIGDNNTAAGREKNRRVVVTLSPQSE